MTEDSSFINKFRDFGCGTEGRVNLLLDLVVLILGLLQGCKLSNRQWWLNCLPSAKFRRREMVINRTVEFAPINREPRFELVTVFRNSEHRLTLFDASNKCNVIFSCTRKYCSLPRALPESLAKTYYYQRRT